MISKKIFATLILSTSLPALYSNVFAQAALSTQVSNSHLQHAIEQFQEGQFALAQSSLMQYFDTKQLPAEKNEKLITNGDYKLAKYYLVLTQLKLNTLNAADDAKNYIATSVDVARYQRIAFALAQHYFYNEDFESAITFYEQAGIDNLNNAEIADAKYELAYSYFNQNKLEASKSLFAAIKDMPNHKYYVPGNYYYGLLAYNDKNYNSALTSFERINEVEDYKDVVPYYEAEINYFLGNHSKTQSLANRYLENNKEGYYIKEMHLLRAQTFFEKAQYKEALTDFEYYFDNSEKVSKDVYYELAYTYYKLKDWQMAIETFKPLSTTKDTLGQTAMYLLGDCYLNTKNKEGARTAFGVCADMDFLPKLKEDATFLHAKLSYELGNEGQATRKLYDYVNTYSSGRDIAEAKSLLSGLLAKNSNYAEAYQVFKNMQPNDAYGQAIFQQVAVGRGLQLMLDKKTIEAEKLFSESLLYPVNKEYTAIAHFWKAELAYNSQDYLSAKDNATAFLSLIENREDLIRKISPGATRSNANNIIGFAEMELGNFADAGLAFVKVQQQADKHDASYDEALVKQGDAAFMQKDFATADKLYAQAQQQSSQLDYLLYQRALIAGLENRNENKIQLLKQVLQNPNAAYKPNAELELATVYMDEDDNEAAIKHLNNLIAQSNNESLLTVAHYKLAYAYQEKGDNDAAISAYKKYLENYPAGSDRAAALTALNALYVKNNDVDGYVDYAREKNLPSIDNATLEQSFYGAAEAEMTQKKWSGAISAFDNYLKKYPNGLYHIHAHYYKGMAHWELKNFTEATNSFEYVINQGWSDFAEDAHEKLAILALDKNEPSKAVIYLDAIFNKVDNKEIAVNLKELYLKALFETNQFEKANIIADGLLAEKDIDKLPLATVQLYKGKLLMQQDDFETAKTYFNKITTQNLGALSAESKYRLAEILFKQGKLADAEKTAHKAAQTSPGQDYWIAKDYLLLADVLVKQKDYFNAIALLESMVKDVKDEKLKQEAQEKLAEAQTLNKSKNKLAD